jgi:hypothetical protein
MSYYKRLDVPWYAQEWAEESLPDDEYMRLSPMDCPIIGKNGYYWCRSAGSIHFEWEGKAFTYSRSKDRLSAITMFKYDLEMDAAGPRLREVEIQAMTTLERARLLPVEAKKKLGRERELVFLKRIRQGRA